MRLTEQRQQVYLHGSFMAARWSKQAPSLLCHFSCNPAKMTGKNCLNMPTTPFIQALKGRFTLQTTSMACGLHTALLSMLQTFVVGLHQLDARAEPCPCVRVAPSQSPTAFRSIHVIKFTNQNNPSLRLSIIQCQISLPLSVMRGCNGFCFLNRGAIY